MNNSKKFIIDGLPPSYDHNYILKTNKKCHICNLKINIQEIEHNLILCTEEFDFAHKKCVEHNDFEILYAKHKDFSSMIKLRKKIKSNTTTIHHEF